jgi:hypothetical protein
MTAMGSERTTGRFSSDLPITRRMLGVGLDGSRRIKAAYVGCLVGPGGSRGIVWMTIGTIRAHPTDKAANASRRSDRQACDPKSLPTTTSAPGQEQVLGSVRLMPGAVEVNLEACITYLRRMT